MSQDENINNQNGSKTRLVLKLGSKKDEIPLSQLSDQNQSYEDNNRSNEYSDDSDSLDDYCAICQKQRIEIAKYKAMVNLFEERDKNNKDIMNEYQNIISEYKQLSKKRKLDNPDDNPRRKKRRRKTNK